MKLARAARQPRRLKHFGNHEVLKGIDLIYRSVGPGYWETKRIVAQPSHRPSVGAQGDR